MKKIESSLKTKLEDQNSEILSLISSKSCNDENRFVKEKSKTIKLCDRKNII